MIVDDPAAIAQLYQSEVRDPRKRRLRPPRSEWIEFRDPKMECVRRCRKCEREFETREPEPVWSVDPTAIGVPALARDLSGNTNPTDSTGAPWVPPGTG